MLDTKARKSFDGIFNGVAKKFNKWGMTPTQVTIIALIIGVSASVVYYFINPVLAVLLLWLSGLLDAVDGALARMTNKSTKIGTLLDVTFDRVVEISILISIALKYENARFALLINACAILMSMTVFLLTGSLAENHSEKSFYYQPGLMERSEGFIMFSLMWLIPKYLNIIIYICAGLILFTAIQRFREAIKLLK